MHISSFDNLRIALKKHVMPDPRLSEKSVLQVLQVGVQREVDSLESTFNGLGVQFHYGSVDALSELSLSAESVDVLVIARPLSASYRLPEVLTCLVEVLSSNGVVIVSAPSGGPALEGQVEPLRVQANAMGVLGSGCSLNSVECWTSPFGPSFEVVGVFRKQAETPTLLGFQPDLSILPAAEVQNSFPPDVPAEVERGAGTQDCYDFLAHIHRELKPRFYAEIGVEYGQSLALAECPALGIDPAPQLRGPLADFHSVSRTTSDDFFRLTDAAAKMQRVDLAYIDGMHQIEFALRDFMNMERFCHSGSVVVVDDIYPAHPLQGERIRQSRFWTGDVWKLIPILEKYRPDLALLPMDTQPTGSLVVLRPDPTNDTLWNRFDEIVEEAIHRMPVVPSSIVERTQKVDPRDPRLAQLFRELRERRSSAQADTRRVRSFAG